jgi:hypothetical protein
MVDMSLKLKMTTDLYAVRGNEIDTQPARTLFKNMTVEYVCHMAGGAVKVKDEYGDTYAIDGRCTYELS